MLDDRQKKERLSNKMISSYKVILSVFSQELPVAINRIFQNAGFKSLTVKVPQFNRTTKEAHTVSNWVWLMNALASSPNAANEKNQGDNTKP